ncbi:MAG: 4-hydroxy-tetrahydrodipicolinate synthase [Clostridiales bacterium]|nr:4-hydroxy-tetrahydrodipicolinate synthase [Clostridiales bacterium]MCF8022200.1 4-hydroxy-tetrahydrodipicolinate synthase [Clostridiales bacterium]
MNADFGRLLTAMVTPFNKDLSINYVQAKNLACSLVDAGCDGLVIAGTTGESPTLSKDEKIELFKVVVEEVGGKAVVIAGTGSNNTADSIALTSEAEKVGVDGVMLVGPYYNKPSQEGLYQHFKTVAESTKLPVMLYNVPGRTGVNILPGCVKKLSHVDNIVAIKEAAGSLDQVSELYRTLPGDFSIYSGDDSSTLPFMAIGGKGIVSVAAHVACSGMKEMIDAFTSGDVTSAVKQHAELFPVYKAMFAAGNPVSVKAALNIMGCQVGSPRLPLVEAGEVEKENIKNVLLEKGLI